MSQRYRNLSFESARHPAKEETIEMVMKMFIGDNKSKVKQSRAVKNSMSKFQRHSLDTGSPEAQIAALSARIESLEEHFKIHRKDLHSKRGYDLMISERGRILKYLKRTDPKKFVEVVKTYKLGLDTEFLVV